MREKMIYSDHPAIRDYYEDVILEGYVGSIAHNTFEESVTKDDKDVMGIYVPPRREVYGLFQTECHGAMVEQRMSEKKTVVWDVVYYSVQKYINLLVKQNPNVISLLWLPERCYLRKTEWGEALIRHRAKFLTKACYHSFSGYAHGQLHRMTHVGVAGSIGARRKELIERFGYDVKNASHLMRLLKMGIEALVTGELIVERPDNNMLLEIKRGEWLLPDVLNKADELFKGLDLALVNSKLPNCVDKIFANQLCEAIVRDFTESRTDGIILEF